MKKGKESGQGEKSVGPMVAARDLYKTLVEASPDGIILSDLTGRILFVNAEACRQMGYSTPLDVTGLNIRQFVSHEFLEKESPASPPLYEKMIGRKFESRIQRKDGSFVPIELNIMLVRGPDGRPELVMGVSRDISDKKAAEKKTQSANEEVTRLFEESQDMMMLFGLDGMIQRVNDSTVKLLGYDSKQDIESVLAWTLWKEKKDVEKFRMTMKTAAKVKDFETIFLRKDGTEMAVLITGSYETDSSGNPSRYRAIVRDITDIKRSEQAMVQLQKVESLGRLASGFTHDFNNIFTAISGYASFMMSQIDSKHPFYQPLEMIDKGVDKAMDLTTKLLAIGQTGPVHTRPCDINQVINNALKLVSTTIGKNIEVRRKFFPEPLVVECDSAMMEQAFLNLLINAKDAIQGSGRIELTSSTAEISTSETALDPILHAGRFIVITISDTGRGMDQDEVSHLFEPFFSTKTEGKGLGLPFVFGIIRKHGGAIRVTSSPGQGSSFQILLPLMQTRSDARGPSSINRKPGKKILVVDDDEMILSFFRDLLTAYGYEHLTALDGYKALEIFKQSKPNIGLVILDIILPRMGGWETLNEIRALDDKVPIFMITGYEPDKVRLNIDSNKATKFLKKPFKMIDVLNSIRDVLPD